MNKYSQNITTSINTQSNKIAKKALKQIQNKSPKKRGKYKKGWKIKTNSDGANSKSYTIYNKTHPQLTHLLENGHAKVNGGRVKGIPHIAPAEHEAIQEFTASVERILNNE